MQVKLLLPFLLQALLATASPNQFNTKVSSYVENFSKVMKTTTAKIVGTSIFSAGAGAGVSALVTNLQRKPSAQGPWGPLFYRNKPDEDMKYTYDKDRDSRQQSYNAAKQSLKEHIAAHDSILADTKTTIVSLFYPAEGQPDLDGYSTVRRPLDVYMDRIQRLLETKTPIIMYTTPDIAKELRLMRQDPYLILVTDYPTVDEIPNIQKHVENFLKRQSEIFATVHTDKGAKAYNRPHNMKVYNAKAWVIRDAIENNPFNSVNIIFADAGFFQHTDVELQSSFGNTKSLEAVLLKNKVPEDSIVISHINKLKSGHHQCWQDPDLIAEGHMFIANVYFGRAEGMKRFADAYFREFDLMDANGWYVGREEHIMSRVAVSNQGLFRCFEVWKHPSFKRGFHWPWIEFANMFKNRRPWKVVDPFVNSSS